MYSLFVKKLFLCIDVTLNAMSIEIYWKQQKIQNDYY